MASESRSLRYRLDARAGVAALPLPALACADAVDGSLLEPVGRVDGLAADVVDALPFGPVAPFVLDHLA